jgi:hypothetical protein
MAYACGGSVSQSSPRRSPPARRGLFWGRIVGFPRQDGFYWAKWRTAEQETRYGTTLTPSDVWDVVYVFQNGDDERQRDFLRVLVVGVEGTQSIENFEWGPGPLTPPA